MKTKVIGLLGNKHLVIRCGAQFYCTLLILTSCEGSERDPDRGSRPTTGGEGLPGYLKYVEVDPKTGNEVEQGGVRVRAQPGVTTETDRFYISLENIETAHYDSDQEVVVLGQQFRATEEESIDSLTTRQIVIPFKWRVTLPEGTTGARVKFLCNPGETTQTVQYFGLATAADLDVNLETPCANGIALLVPAVASGACPENYIPIPANSQVGADSDFCVMKYEARNGVFTHGNIAYSEDFVVVGNLAHTPWVKITRTQAISECQALGSGYDLISNPQWQAIARNIEGVIENWSAAPGGLGVLNRGHSADQVSTEAKAASADNDGCNSTGQTCDLQSWNLLRRTHRLSNGEVIWDMAGNVREWTKSVITDTEGTSGLVCMAPWGPLAKATWGPAGDYAHKYIDDSMECGGLGNFERSQTVVASVSRGGSWQQGHLAGVFASQLKQFPDTTNDDLGFRCVFIGEK